MVWKKVRATPAGGREEGRMIGSSPPEEEKRGISAGIWGRGERGGMVFTRSLSQLVPQGKERRSRCLGRANCYPVNPP